MGRPRSRIAATGLAGLAVLLAVGAQGGCGGGGGTETETGTGTGTAVAPTDDLVSARNEEGVAGFVHRLLRKCGEQLRNGQNEELAEWTGKVRALDGPADRRGPVPADSGRRAAVPPSPEAQSVCRVCGGTAEVNLGRYEEGLAELREAEELRAYFPGPVSEDLTELMLRSEVVGYAGVGDQVRMQEALDELVEVDPASAAAYVKECEQAVPPGSGLRCGSPTPVLSPGGPSPGPRTTSPAVPQTTPPGPTDTGPETTDGPGPTDGETGGEETTDGPGPTDGETGGEETTDGPGPTDGETGGEETTDGPEPTDGDGSDGPEPDST
ncbi:hypothetical protein GCM10010126_41740 [Planomonospora parontospora]|uniref:Uncharacterized protein n=1 Tax=Planomonospora parontospora TaxID=58119 RepID=A0AA37F5N8_9ACTN|nr:hypothetical protein [Planomonospora parontospora]GGK77967.1 hypothetical protein GCM10010126_41740 [Planomonospora parontospora]